MARELGGATPASPNASKILPLACGPWALGFDLVSTWGSWPRPVSTRRGAMAFYGARQMAPWLLVRSGGPRGGVPRFCGPGPSGFWVILTGP